MAPSCLWKDFLYKTSCVNIGTLMSFGTTLSQSCEMPKTGGEGSVDHTKVCPETGGAAGSRSNRSCPLLTGPFGFPAGFLTDKSLTLTLPILWRFLISQSLSSSQGTSHGSLCYTTGWQCSVLNYSTGSSTPTLHDVEDGLQGQLHRGKKREFWDQNLRK